MSASQWLAMYREREKLFGRLPEASWRILLELVGGSLQTTSIDAGVPGTTLLRHLRVLESEGLIRRQTGEDRRRTIVSLTRHARDLLSSRNITTQEAA